MVLYPRLIRLFEGSGPSFPHVIPCFWPSRRVFCCRWVPLRVCGRYACGYAVIRLGWRLLRGVLAAVWVERCALGYHLVVFGLCRVVAALPIFGVLWPLEPLSPTRSGVEALVGFCCLFGAWPYDVSRTSLRRHPEASHVGMFGRGCCVCPRRRSWSPRSLWHTSGTTG